MRPLEGKVALVTGAGTRLGRALAEGLGHLGATVALHCHSSREGAEAAAAAIRVDGNRAQVFAADLSDPKAPELLVRSAQAELGALDILVNSAARFERGDLVDADPQTLDGQWAVNARAPWLLCREVAPSMLAKGRGDIINIVDIGGALMPWRHYSAYLMTKAALASLTQSLALELAPAVRVNAVAPGAVLPPDALTPEQLDSLRAKIPQQRFGSPDDVVQTVAFLLSGPRFITGQIIAVDGGRSLAGG